MACCTLLALCEVRLWLRGRRGFLILADMLYPCSLTCIVGGGKAACGCRCASRKGRGAATAAPRRLFSWRVLPCFSLLNCLLQSAEDILEDMAWGGFSRACFHAVKLRELVAGKDNLVKVPG